MDYANPDRVVFQGWKGVPAPAPLSQLYWALGVDWPRVGIAAAAAAGTIAAVVLLPWYAAVVPALVLIFMTANIWLAARNWNSGTGWRGLHTRASILVLSCVGAEQSRSEIEDREFNSKLVGKELLTRLCPHAKQGDVAALINASGQSMHLWNLFEHYLRMHRVPNEPDIELIARYQAEMEGADKTPIYVLCRLVENTFGRDEAAEYLVALVTGEANAQAAPALGK